MDGARAWAGRVILVAVGLAAFLLAGRWAGSYVPEFAARVEALGAWGPIVFIGGYIVATVAFIPGSLLTLAAGAIFGSIRLPGSLTERAAGARVGRWG